jgi:hypothetical protein
VVHSAAHIFYTVLYLSSRHGPKKNTVSLDRGLNFAKVLV